ncbi:ACT domain-containing protein [Desulfovibrio sp. OttesenSCG-928-A18]|nr:ACT domain-containing protein [Desulfovibrio sp. OttesenSCG-928-A18]
MDAGHPAAISALRLVVNNHPGVMSHICGLFARRAFNLEGILVNPLDDGAVCAIWLFIKEDERMEQILRQVRKLHDVLDARVADLDEDAFSRLANCL